MVQIITKHYTTQRHVSKAGGVLQEYVYSAAQEEDTIMFNPHLSQREKEINRQEALAYAERDRLVRLAKGQVSRWWHLSLPVAAVLDRVRAWLERPRPAGRLEGSTQR